MKERVHSDHGRTSQAKPQAAPTGSETPAPALARGSHTTPVPARVLSLQQTIGNRATAQALARWAAHPDKDKKGVLLPDTVATEFLRFNPPKNS